MRFVSYSQNFEDVMLWRALRHVRGGFYIDVGANDPVKDSVTKAFSERGWRGINIEPVAAHHADLERDRPLDTNLRCAVGAADGSIELWECEVPGLATTDPAVAEQHEREGRQGRWYEVPVRTLAAICEQHAEGGEIHFLKVDVEGGEESVLRGADFSRFRPWIVVIEATRPNSTEQRHEQWEHLLTDARYRFAYADGLNRFYVASEHEELAAALVYPPNVFDNFMVAQQFNAELWWKRAEDRAEQLQRQLESLSASAAAAHESLTASAAAANERALQFSARAVEAETRTQEYVGRAARAEERASHLNELLQSAHRTIGLRDGQLEHLNATLAHMYASSSWRVTKPLRWISGWLKGERRLRAHAAQPAGLGPQPASQPAAQDAGQPLPPRAREAYAAMKSAGDAVGKDS